MPECLSECIPSHHWSSKGDALHRTVLCEAIFCGGKKRKYCRQSAAEAMPSNKELVIFPYCIAVSMYRPGYLVILASFGVLTLSKKIEKESSMELEEFLLS
jgi:hypothetical protein